MRQLLAATVLLALMGLPALYFLRDTPEVRAVAHAVGAGIEGAAETGAADAIVEGMHRVAAGLAASLQGAQTSAGEFSVATIHDETARDVSVAIGMATGRGDATQTGSIKLAAGKDHDLRTGPADSSDREQDVAETGPDGHGLPGYRDRGNGAADLSAPWRTPVSPAAMNGGNTLPRDYPTSFLWFDLI